MFSCKHLERLGLRSRAQQPQEAVLGTGPGGRIWKQGGRVPPLFLSTCPGASWQSLDSLIITLKLRLHDCWCARTGGIAHYVGVDAQVEAEVAWLRSATYIPTGFGRVCTWHGSVRPPRQPPMLPWLHGYLYSLALIRDTASVVLGWLRARGTIPAGREHWSPAVFRPCLTRPLC